jgi:hypothetical protein
MKTVISTFLLALALSTELTYGQTFKIQYGRDWSTLKWPKNGEYSIFKSSLNGNTFFFGIDYFNRKYFNLSSNIGYLQKQGTKSYDKYYDNTHTTLVQAVTSIEQLSINTKVNIKYPIKDKLVPFLCVGLCYDNLLSQSHKEDRISNAESGIFGLILGGGAYYKISRIQIGLNIDYSDYLSNFALLEERPSPGMTGFLPAEKIKSHTILLGVTFAYVIK